MVVVVVAGQIRRARPTRHGARARVCVFVPSLLAGAVVAVGVHVAVARVELLDEVVVLDAGGPRRGKRLTRTRAVQE